MDGTENDTTQRIVPVVLERHCALYRLFSILLSSHVESGMHEILLHSGSGLGSGAFAMAEHHAWLLVFLECQKGICNELLKFLSDAGEHFFRHVQLSSAWTYLKSSLNVRVATLTLYFLGSLLNFMKLTVDCFMNFLHGLFTENVVLR